MSSLLNPSTFDNIVPGMTDAVVLLTRSALSPVRTEVDEFLF